MTLRTLFQYVGALIRPVTTRSETVLCRILVGADRIRPWHKAPPLGALCRVDMLVDPYSPRVRSSGAIENPGFRADAIRPYS